MAEPPIAFVSEPGLPGLEIRVNFGVFAGREATAAEIDELARDLRARVEEFSIVSEERHEFGDDVEAAVILVRIELPAAADDELRGRLLEIAERWAQACVAERHAEVAEL